MQAKLNEFIGVLRHHDIPVSTAEALDAQQAVALVGYGDRMQLCESLAAVVCKHNEHRVIYERCFNHFFAFNPPGTSNAQAANNEASTEEAERTQSPEEQQLNDNPNDSMADWLANSDYAGEPMLEALVAGDRALRDTLLAQAATEVGLDTIEIFTQIAPLTQRLINQTGGQALNRLVTELRTEGNPMAMEFERLREQLRGAAREYVQRAHLLHGEQASRRLREENLFKTRLNWLSPTELAAMDKQIRKLARKLAARHKRRQRTFRRGQLDVSRTLYRNVGHDGVPFYTRWKKIKKERPDVYVICDVSGSVAPFARFLLTFLYSLSDILPKVRSFAFSTRLGEITEELQQGDPDKALTQVLAQWGGGVTCYDLALDDFMALCEDRLSSRSTVIILGDARNNYGHTNVETLRRIYRRVHRVLWLNPEGLHNWDTGDSEMRTYQTATHLSYQCGTLKQLERAVSQLLKSIC